jgi:hypothetical protein
MNGRQVLEAVSRAVEAHPRSEDRVIRHHAKVARKSGDAALKLLLDAGFIQREQEQGVWLYWSLKPYRAADFEKRTFGATHSAAAGGDG